MTALAIAAASVVLTAAAAPALAREAIAPSRPAGSGTGASRSGDRGAGLGLANRCFAIRSAANARFVAIAGADAYRAAKRHGALAARFYLKPTRFGSYLLHDQEGKLLATGERFAVSRAREPGPPAEWAVARRSRHSYVIRSRTNGRELVVEPAGGGLLLALAGRGGRSGRFDFLSTRGCRRFPEAEVGAFGRPPRRTDPDGSVFGFADLHLHVTAELRAGGRVIHGKSFDRFGISRALGGDELDHGRDGSSDLIGNLLRTGVPDATHDPHGWPSFAGWPVHDTYTHQQTYYVWLKRAWRAGLRLAVAQAVEDEPLCRLAPLRAHSCDELETVKLEIRRLLALQDYIDAQSGGRGRGWLRLVYNPRQARRVIERGKLAVVIGMETSSPLCSGLGERRGCTRSAVDRGLDELHRLGVRSMFVAHWIDNAFAGPALQPGANGEFIGLMQAQQTGRPFRTEPCAGADEAEGVCNSRGLTRIGRYLVRRMRARGLMIEVDHLSQKARKAVLAIAAARRLPVVSSHTDTGGEWTARQLGRLYRLGSLASATPETAPGLAAKILRLRRHAGRPPGRPAVALGSDTGGLASLPGPRAGGDPLRYPFTSYDGRLRFARQRSGERVFDLNVDGVAHYGLFADLLADIQRRRRGRKALTPLFRSAEAYLRMWERATR